MGRVDLVFYGQGKIVGTLAVGRGFLSTQHHGNFYSRPVSNDDLDQILGLVGLTRLDLERT